MEPPTRQSQSDQPDETPSALRGWIDDALDRITRHPLLVQLQAGRAGFPRVARWVYCAGRESRAFPGMLEGMLTWSTDPVLTHVLRANLDDELGNGNPSEAHFQHYQHLLPELGLSVDQFNAYVEGPGITTALRAADYVATCRNEPLALGYMLINEAMTPAIYGAVESGLLSDGIQVRSTFFRLHVASDEQHVAMLLQACAGPFSRDAESVRDGLLLGERCMAVLLDEANGVFDGTRQATSGA